MIEVTTLQAWAALVMVMLALIGAATVLTLTALAGIEASRLIRSRTIKDPSAAIRQIRQVGEAATREFDELSLHVLTEVRQWVAEAERQRAMKVGSETDQ